MNVNVPLMRKVLEHVEQEFAQHGDPRDRYMAGDWVQGSWGEVLKEQVKGLAEKDENGYAYQVIDCGTSGCFAGHAVMMSGGKMVVTENDLDDDDDDIIGVDTALLDGKLVDIREAAAKLLGLDEFWAAQLFSPSNTVHDLRELCERFVGEKI